MSEALNERVDDEAGWPALRLAGFGLWVAILIICPVGRVLTDIPFRPSWQMYRGYASGLCAVRAYERVDGKFQQLERHKLLGYESPFDVPKQLRRATTEAQANGIVKAMCARADGPLNVLVECGRAGGWHVERSRKDDACAATAAKPGAKR